MLLFGDEDTLLTGDLLLLLLLPTEIPDLKVKCAGGVDPAVDLSPFTLSTFSSINFLDGLGLLLSWEYWESVELGNGSSLEE